MKTLPFALILLLSFLFSCEPEEIDPCENIGPFEANFQILEIVGDSLIETDKVMMYNVVQFSTPKKYRSYSWKIGEDDREFTDPVVTLQFPQEALGKIEVTLIASPIDYNSCYPEIKPLDTLTKSFEVIEWSKSPMIGRYQGSFTSSPGATDTVEVRFISVNEDIRYEPFGGFQLINVNKGCNLDAEDSGFWSGRRGTYAMTFDASSKYWNGCEGIDAQLRIYKKDNLTINFSTADINTANKRIYDSFIGVKL